MKCKGLEDPTTVQRVTTAIHELGYRQLLIKADGEPAQRACVRDVIEEACRASTVGEARCCSQYQAVGVLVKRR